MEKKRIVAFFDGRPGHEKQTLGVIAALRDLYDVDLREVQVEKSSLWQTIQSFLALFFPWNKNYTVIDVAGADLLMGTGSSTHLPMLLAKKKYDVQVVTCMSPNILLRHAFDLCLVPEHDGLPEVGNIRLTLGAPNLARNSGQHQERSGLIAVGGKDEKSHFWDSETIIEQVKTIVAKDVGIFWTITSSPRTPAETVQGLSESAKQYKNCSFFGFSETKPGWIEEQYAESSYVWVTSDSISMIFEALSSGCRVGILPMRWKRQEGKFQRNEDILRKNSLVITYNEWFAGVAEWPLGQILNESQKCAHLIQTLWQTRN